MTVTINKTDGTVLTTVADGTADTSTTNIALIGRLYKNYGELINENMVKLLENFASTNSPSSPIIGQLWYDKNAETIKVYRDTGFIPLARITTSSAEPNTPSTADLWYDLTDQQLKYYNGANWIVISPGYTASQGRTGSFAETIQDTTDANHVAVVLRQQESAVAIISKDPEYTPKTSIIGYSGNVKPGFNLGTGLTYNGSSAEAVLFDGLTSSQFLRSDQNDTTSGTLGVLNDGGLTLGADSDLTIDISSTTARIRKLNTGSLHFLMENDLAAVINSNEQFQLQDGSALVPKLSWINDPDTGFYKPGNGNLAVSVNGLMRSYWTTEGMHVDGTLHATSTLTVTQDAFFESDVSITSNITVGGPYVTLGNTSDDNVIIYGSNIDIPNDVTFKTGDVTFQGYTTMETGAIVLADFEVIGDVTIDGNSVQTGNANIVGNFTLDGNTTLNGTSIVYGNTTVSGGTFTVAVTDSNDFKIDSSGRILINRGSPRSGYGYEGDISLGSNTDIYGFARDNAIFARNVPKHVITFDGRFDDLFIYRDHHVGGLTRVTTGTYILDFEDYDGNPLGLASAYPTIIGSVSGTDQGYIGYNNAITGGDTSVIIYTYNDAGSLVDFARVNIAIWDGAN